MLYKRSSTTKQLQKSVEMLTPHMQPLALQAGRIPLVPKVPNLASVLKGPGFEKGAAPRYP